jgi:hypothetical protein
MGLLTNPYDEMYKPDIGIVVVFYVFLLLILKIIFTISWVYLLLYFILKLVLFIGNIVLDWFLVNYAFKTLNVYKLKVSFYAIVIFTITLELLIFYYDGHMFSEKWFFILDGAAIIGSFIYNKIKHYKRIRY